MRVTIPPNGVDLFRLRIYFDGKVYVGWGISFDFSKGAKIGIGVGIGYEITLNF